MVTAILSRFWQNEDEPEDLRIIEMRSWMDVLKDVSHADFRAAWADYLKTGPRSGKGVLYRPDAGAIFLRVEAIWRDRALVDRHLALPAPEPAPRPPVTAEAAARIIREIYGDAAGEDGFVDPGYVAKKMPTEPTP